jgi:hypothetical protein
VAAAVEEDAGVASREELVAGVVVQPGVLMVSVPWLLSTTKKMPRPPSRALLPQQGHRACRRPAQCASLVAMLYGLGTVGSARATEGSWTLTL